MLMKVARHRDVKFFFLEIFISKLNEIAQTFTKLFNDEKLNEIIVLIFIVYNRINGDYEASIVLCCARPKS